MTPGTLDSRITFTRSTTAKYFDVTGTMQTAAVNAPRWDYDPVAHTLNGLLIEEVRTNLWLQSADASQGVWVKGGSVVAAPTVTANQIIAPDGTTTAGKVIYPTVTGTSALSTLYQGITVTAVPYAFSVWMKGNVGGEQIYLYAVNGSTYSARSRVTLTTSWQRFTMITSALTAASWYFAIGCDLRDAGQSTISAQTIYVWGAQVELGANATSYIPVAGAPATRQPDLVSMPTATWFNAATGTWQAQFIPNGAAATLPVVVSGNAGSPVIAIGADSKLVASIRSGAAVFSGTGPSMTFGAVNKAAFAYQSGASRAAVNATVIGPSATALSVTGTTVEFGSDGVTPGNNALDGWLRSASYWPRVLSNAELQSATT
jgi:hypothetical protein